MNREDGKEIDDLTGVHWWQGSKHVKSCHGKRHVTRVRSTIAQKTARMAFLGTDLNKQSHHSAEEHAPEFPEGNLHVCTIQAIPF